MTDLSPEAVERALEESRANALDAIGNRLRDIYWDVERIRNCMEVTNRDALRGWHSSEAHHLAEKLRDAAGRLEGLAE